MATASSSTASSPERRNPNDAYVASSSTSRSPSLSPSRSRSRSPTPMDVLSSSSSSSSSPSSPHSRSIRRTTTLSSEDSDVWEDEEAVDMDADGGDAAEGHSDERRHHVREDDAGHLSDGTASGSSSASASSDHTASSGRGRRIQSSRRPSRLANLVPDTSSASAHLSGECDPEERQSVELERQEVIRGYKEALRVYRRSKKALLASEWASFGDVEFGEDDDSGELGPRQGREREWTPDVEESTPETEERREADLVHEDATTMRGEAAWADEAEPVGRADGMRLDASFEPTKDGRGSPHPGPPHHVVREGGVAQGERVDRERTPVPDSVPPQLTSLNGHAKESNQVASSSAGTSMPQTPKRSPLPLRERGEIKEALAGSDANHLIRQSIPPPIKISAEPLAEQTNGPSSGKRQRQATDGTDDPSSSAPSTPRATAPPSPAQIVASPAMPQGSPLLGQGLAHGAEAQGERRRKSAVEVDGTPKASAGAAPNGAAAPPSTAIPSEQVPPSSPAPTVEAPPPPLSLWEYLKEEVLASEPDAGASASELKWERVTNFIAIPFWMEKIILFGFAVCLDSFLYTFTILPIRFLLAAWRCASNMLRWLFLGERKYLHSAQKCDLLKGILVVSSCVVLARATDASKMYHSVRGQDVVKLYVIFNVLEIADRLCCSFGQDLLDTLFSRITLARRRDGSQPFLRPLGFFLLSLAYILAHTLVLFYQLVTLNVAINSYDNALLTLLLSNQFVEIKGSVFKKFEKENLFQLTCADIVERFQLTLMLSAIGLRNLIEVAGASAGEGGVVPLPTSFTVFPSLNLLETIFTPVLIVLLSECLVDWLKHAFITKFNHIRPSVYGRFMDVLCRDLVSGDLPRRRRHTMVDQSPAVARRLGFAALPLACLLVRITSQILGMLRDTSHFDECAAPQRLRGGLAFASYKDREELLARVFDVLLQGGVWVLTIGIAWAFLVALKLLLGANLVSFASRRCATLSTREEEEQLNARNRNPIGVDPKEAAYEKRTTALLDREKDDAPKGQFGGRNLMDVERWMIVKSRVW